MNRSPIACLLKLKPRESPKQVLQTLFLRQNKQTQNKDAENHTPHTSRALILLPGHKPRERNKALKYFKACRLSLRVSAAEERL